MCLGPQHLLEPLVKEVNKRRNKEYLYKRTAHGAFAEAVLKDTNVGAAVKTKRSKEEEKAKRRLPLKFWSSEFITSK